MKKALLVEDMPKVRETMTKMLSSLNVDVVAVDSAEMARDCVRKDGGFDLMISDAIIPGTMNGAELARSVRKDQKDLPVLLITGFASQFARLQRSGEEGVSLLKKPFTEEGLSKAVDRALGTAPA